MPTLSVSRSQIYVGPCQLSTFMCALKMYFYSRVCVCVCASIGCVSSSYSCAAMTSRCPSVLRYPTLTGELSTVCTGRPPSFILAARLAISCDHTHRNVGQTRVALKKKEKKNQHPLVSSQTKAHKHTCGTSGDALRHRFTHTHTHTHKQTLRHARDSLPHSLFYFITCRNSPSPPSPRFFFPSHKLLYVRISERQWRPIHQPDFSGPLRRE